MEKSLTLHDWVTDWRLKALLQFVFSFIPRGDRLNYLVQRYVIKSLPGSDAAFTTTVSYAKRHIDAIQRFYKRPIAEATFYEFGAGWDMTIPLAFYGFGINHQIVVDIRNLIKFPLVNDTIHKYQRLASSLCIPRIATSRLDHSTSTFSKGLKEHYGIDYRAPCDAKQTGLPSCSIDCITSTNTMEHIPQPDIRSILSECQRILCDDGLMSVLIDYDDHYSYFDKKRSRYNFLRYSDRLWSVFNPPLHYQNRMRHCDYIKLFESTGFEVVEDQHKGATEQELKTLAQLSLHSRFKNYDLGALAVHSAFLVVRKRPVRTCC